MTSIFNTSWEHPGMHAWCKFGDSSSNLLSCGQGKTDARTDRWTDTTTTAHRPERPRGIVIKPFSTATSKCQIPFTKSEECGTIAGWGWQHKCLSPSVHTSAEIDGKFACHCTTLHNSTLQWCHTETYTSHCSDHSTVWSPDCLNMQ